MPRCGRCRGIPSAVEGGSSCFYLSNQLLLQLLGNLCKNGGPTTTLGAVHHVDHRPPVDKSNGTQSAPASLHARLKDKSRQQESDGKSSTPEDAPRMIHLGPAADMVEREALVVLVLAESNNLVDLVDSTLVDGSSRP